MNTPSLPNRFPLHLLAVSAFGLFLLLFQIRSQPVSPDDYMVALSAINYMESGQFGPTMWNHPELRNILVYFSMYYLGTGVLGVKGWSLLFGAICIPLTGVVARKFTSDDRTALLAAFLMAIDPLAIDFSRQAINDVYLAFFPLLGLYMAFRFMETGGRLQLIGSGICFGLGLASKWSAIFPLLVTLAMLINNLYDKTGCSIRNRVSGCIHAVVLLTILPVTVYLLTFIPWFGRGYSMTEWLTLQKSMYLETAQHSGYKPKSWDDRDNRAWKWFIVPFPKYVDPFVNMDVAGEDVPLSEWKTDKNMSIVLGVGNPLVWMLVLPAAFFAAWRGFRTRQKWLSYMAALFFISYLPLALTARPIWMNTALSVLPFALIPVAWLVCTVYDSVPRYRPAIKGYVCLILISSMLLYPLAIGKGLKIPVIRDYLQHRFMPKAGHNAR